jgi:hypothetical protein
MRGDFGATPAGSPLSQTSAAPSRTVTKETPMKCPALLARLAPLFALLLSISACQGVDEGTDDPSGESISEEPDEVLAAGADGCSASRHLCGGVCVTNNSPQHCGVACVPCNGIPHGKATCIAKADAHICSAKCNSGFKMCRFECIPSKKRCN